MLSIAVKGVSVLHFQLLSLGSAMDKSGALAN